MGSVIHSVGLCSGERVLTNQDLEKILSASNQETNDKWIFERTGIRNRRVSPGRSLGDLAFEASKSALDSCLVFNEPIKHIVVATNTQRHAFPNTAGFLQAELSKSHPHLIDKRSSGVDLGGGCGGINFALMHASSLISEGYFDNVLVVGAEKLTDVTDYSDRTTCILFGDGASAFVLGKGAKDYGFVDHPSKGNGECRDLITCVDKPKVDLAGALGFLDKGEIPQKVVGPVLEMDGRRVFRYVVDQWEKLLEDLGETYHSIHYISPHLANLRCLQTVNDKHPGFMEKCGLTSEESLSNFHNTSTASQGRRVREFLERGKSGERLLMFGYGAGLQSCANLYVKP